MKNPAIQGCLRRMIGKRFDHVVIIFSAGNYITLHTDDQHAFNTFRIGYRTRLKHIITLIDANKIVLKAREIE